MDPTQSSMTGTTQSSMYPNYLTPQQQQQMQTYANQLYANSLISNQGQPKTTNAATGMSQMGRALIGGLMSNPTLKGLFGGSSSPGQPMQLTSANGGPPMQTSNLDLATAPGGMSSPPDLSGGPQPVSSPAPTSQPSGDPAFSPNGPNAFPPSWSPGSGGADGSQSWLSGVPQGGIPPGVSPTDASTFTGLFGGN